MLMKIKSMILNGLMALLASAILILQSARSANVAEPVSQSLGSGQSVQLTSKQKGDAVAQQLLNLSTAISYVGEAANSLTNTSMREALQHHVELAKKAQQEQMRLEQEIKEGVIKTPKADGEWRPVRGDKNRKVMSRFEDKDGGELCVLDAKENKLQWLHYAVPSKIVFSFTIFAYADNDFANIDSKPQLPGLGYDFNFYGDGYLATASCFGLPEVLEVYPQGRLKRFTMKPAAEGRETGEFNEAIWDENGKLLKATQRSVEEIAQAKKRIATAIETRREQSSHQPLPKTGPGVVAQQLQDLSLAVSRAAEEANSMTNAIMRTALQHQVTQAKTALQELEKIEKEIKDGVRKKELAYDRSLWFEDKEKNEHGYVEYFGMSGIIMSYHKYGFSNKDDYAKNEHPTGGYVLVFDINGCIRSYHAFDAPVDLAFHTNGWLRFFSMQQLEGGNDTEHPYEAFWDEKGKFRGEGIVDRRIIWHQNTK